MLRGARTVAIALGLLVLVPTLVLSGGDLLDEPAVVLAGITVALFAVAVTKASRQWWIAGWTTLVLFAWVLLLAPGGLLFQPRLRVDRFKDVRYGHTMSQVQDLLGGPPGNYGRSAGVAQMTTEGFFGLPGGHVYLWSDESHSFEVAFFDDHVIATHERARFGADVTLASRVRRILQFRRVAGPREVNFDEYPRDPRSSARPLPAATPGIKSLHISRDKPVRYTAMTECSPRLQVFKHWSDADRALSGGPGGLLWFVGGRWLGQFSASGAGWAIPIGAADMTSAAPGPDGALWVTDAHSIAIRRFSFDGQMSTFPVPTRDGMPALGGSFPTAMTRGPDGALWFLEANADKLARISTDGGIAEYDIPRGDTYHLHPEEMTVGPDGALWFTMRYRNAIGRYDVRTKRFSMVDTPAPATRIAGGAGGVWFADGDMTIGKIVRSRTIERIRVHADALAIGSDGNIWVRGKDSVVVLRPDGTTARRYPIHIDDVGRVTSGILGGMTSGPDGAMWVSKPDTGRMIRIGCAPATS
jgi:virginiamycin B lyase